MVHGRDEPPQRPVSSDLEPSAIEWLDELWASGPLRPIDLDGLAALMHLDGGPTQRDMAYAIVDLADLLDEIRFAVGQGVMLDLRSGEDSLAASAGARGLVMSPELQAMLITIPGAPLPSPHTVFDHLDRRIAGARRVGPWLAAQHLDSAVLRTFAALDRIATILQLASGKPLKIVQDEPRYPTFNRAHLEGLAQSLRPDSAIGVIVELFEHDAMRAGRIIRDHFVHRPRYRFTGHGAVHDEYGDGTFKRHPTHRYVSLGIELYEAVLRSTVASTIEILNHPDQPPLDGWAAEPEKWIAHGGGG